MWLSDLLKKQERFNYPDDISGSFAEVVFGSMAGSFIIEYRNRFVRWNVKTLFWTRHNSKKKKESRKRAVTGFLAVALFMLLSFASYSATKAVVTSSTYGDRELPIYCVDTTEKKIALSFDAAWGADDFENIMNILDQHNVKVTFFMTGGWVDEYPECVKELVERGHDLGNHSEHHYDMTTISQEEKKNELMSVHDKVKELTGYEMFLFRPPYGAYDNAVIKTAYECNYYPIQWSVDSLDWKDYGVDSIIKTVCNHSALEPGAIILCHNGAKYTAQALDTMLTNLEEQGYQIVPISELIMREDYHMDVTGKQISDNPAAAPDSEEATQEGR